jgi:putative ABC transport system permease protein
MRERLSRIPGVQGVALVAGLPPQRPINANDTYIEGLVPTPGGPIHNVDYWNAVSPGYFELAGVPLVAGRSVEERDGAGAPPVLVVNETFARTFYGSQSALGRRVKPGGGPNNQDVPWFTIVGVVKDVKNQGLDRAAGTELYFSHAQLGNRNRSMGVLLKGSGDPWDLVRPARHEIRQIDNSLPISQVRPLEDAISQARAQPRFLALLLGLFALVAMGLAALGIFSVMSYTVAQRTNEFGVRMALGADGRDVLRLVLSQGLRVICLGLLLGGACAAALARLMQGVVFGVGEFRLIPCLATTALLLLVTLLACYGPARRATKVDPMVALRYE